MPIASTFIRRNGAGGMGHVGWAFEYTKGNSIIGAIENFTGSPFVDPGHKGMWHRLVPNNRVLNYFKAMNYDEYKRFDLPVHAINANGAVAVLKWWEQKPYNVIVGNCLHATYDVLTRYGVTLPKADWERVVPNNWYNQLPGVSHVVVPNLNMFTMQEISVAALDALPNDGFFELPGEAEAP
jgi:hypothetical protein